MTRMIVFVCDMITALAKFLLGASIAAIVLVTLAAVWWRYVIDNLFGNVTRVFCKAASLRLRMRRPSFSYRPSRAAVASFAANANVRAEAGVRMAGAGAESVGGAQAAPHQPGARQVHEQCLDRHVGPQRAPGGRGPGQGGAAGQQQQQRCRRRQELVELAHAPCPTRALVAVFV